MAGSVNKAVIIGRLGKDPEVRSLQDGKKIVNLSVATSESWNDRASGERKERTEWHRVVIFNERIGEVAEKYLKKGALVYIEGSLQTRKWTDQSGQEKYATEVVIAAFRGEMTMLERSGDGGEGGSSTERRPASGGSTNSRAHNAARGRPGNWEAPGGGDLDEEIPF